MTEDILAWMLIVTVTMTIQLVVHFAKVNNKKICPGYFWKIFKHVVSVIIT